jgi:hypothetical protein
MSHVERVLHLFESSLRFQSPLTIYHLPFTIYHRSHWRLSDGRSRGMRSVPPRGSGWVVSHLVIKVRQIISLTVHYIVDGSDDALFVP